MKKNHNGLKLFIALVLVLTITALFISVIMVNDYGIASALLWHQRIGIFILCLVPIHIVLHFKKLKKLVLESLQHIHGMETQLDKKERIVNHFKHLSMRDFALFHRLSFEDLSQFFIEEYQVTLQPEERLAEVSKRLHVEVFSLFLAIVDFRLSQRN